MTAIDTSTTAVTALMDGVTEGPWYLSSGHMQSNGQLYWQVETAYDAVVNNQFCWAQGDHGANARFIAAARQLVPALVAERDAADQRAAALLARVAALEADCAAARNAAAENYARAEKAEAERDAALAGVVKVKPLVWEKLGERAWRAPSPFFGSFRVECYGGGPWQALWSVPGFCDTFVDGDFAGPDDAKQAIDARIRAALQPDPDARQADLAKAWQPIETAPRGVEVGGNNAVSWMVLAWPDGEGGYHRQSGMMVGEKFYAAPAFYIGGWHGVKHYALREIEIFPTHWMPDPPPPADLAANIGGDA